MNINNNNEEIHSNKFNYYKLFYSLNKNNKNYIILMGKEFKKENNNDIFLEHMINVINNSINEYNKIYVIIDLYKLKKKNVKLKIINKITKMFKILYPDILEKCVIINVPSFFFSIYNMLKPFLDKETRNKIEIKKNDSV